MDPLQIMSIGNRMLKTQSIGNISTDVDSIRVFLDSIKENHLASKKIVKFGFHSWMLLKIILYYFSL